ncbi:MAG: hypothetical protein MUE85_25165 [Microscillaceae bacterium]|nr:hypothetical protein [Microscillaceae bacterium]
MIILLKKYYFCLINKQKMTRLEYEQLPRFDEVEHIFPKNSTFGEASVFECHTLDGEVRYLRVTCAVFNLFFDLKECNQIGRLLRKGHKIKGAKREEILDLIAQNWWRLYKQHSREV